MKSTAPEMLALHPTMAGWIRLSSIGGGIAASFLILLGIAKAQKTSLPIAAPVMEELRALEPEPPPPPLPPDTAPVEPPPPSALELDPLPSERGIKIATSIQPVALPVPPVAQISFELDLENFKPTAASSSSGGRRTYHVAEVDRRPVATYQKSPKFFQSAVKGLRNPHVVLMFVVNVNGIAEDIRVLHAPNEELTQATLEAMHDWKFRPAMKDGRKVRCLVQQTVVLAAPDPGPFSVR